MQPDPQKTLQWPKLKSGNLIHEPDCEITWMVTQVDHPNGLAILKRMKGSVRQGPVSAVIEESSITKMHRIEECVRRAPKIKQGFMARPIKKKKKKKKKKEPNAATSTRKPPTKALPPRRGHRGVRNPPHQA